MADSEIPIGTMRQRLTGLLTDWGADFSELLAELEDKRARLEALESGKASQTRDVDALSKQVEAQDTLIESLNIDAGEAATLRKELHDRELELESRSAEIDSKQALIGALRRDTEGLGRLKGDGRVKDQEIARLTREKQEAEQRVADVTEEFDTLAASTLTNIDAVGELDAVRAELDARKSLIESLRGDADRARALEAQLEEKRDVISKLETSIDRHASSIAELQETGAAWKAKYFELKTKIPVADSANLPASSAPSEPGLYSLDDIEDISGDLRESTISVDMRERLLKSQQAPGKKITTNR